MPRSVAAILARNRGDPLVRRLKSTLKVNRLSEAEDGETGRCVETGPGRNGTTTRTGGSGAATRYLSDSGILVAEAAAAAAADVEEEFTCVRCDKKWMADPSGKFRVQCKFCDQRHMACCGVKAPFGVTERCC